MIPNFAKNTGVFKILEKKRNKTLVGNIVPETGQPEYRTTVSYWARVTWSGIGFHDATWQPAFGGDLIAYVSQFYTLKIGDLLYTGTPVGVGPVSIGQHLEGYLEGEKLLDFYVR